MGKHSLADIRQVATLPLHYPNGSSMLVQNLPAIRKAQAFDRLKSDKCTAVLT